METIKNIKNKLNEIPNVIYLNRYLLLTILFSIIALLLFNIHMETKNTFFKDLGIVFFALCAFSYLSK